MATENETVTAELLKTWGLPAPGDSKKSRGRVLVVGGSVRSPGAVMLAGEAALRVGAGKVGLVVPEILGMHVGMFLPEVGIYPLPESARDGFDSAVSDELARADAVLVGPGFDDPARTRATIEAVAEAMDPDACLVLDAFGIGVLPDLQREELPARLLLTPNEEEASILLERPVRALEEDVPEIARRYDAVVNCYGVVAEPRGSTWRLSTGGPGLGTSGSGDVLAGAITGFAARGVPADRAAVWGGWAHGRAGDRLTASEGLGFLARDLLPELTRSLHEVDDGRKDSAAQ
jgi:hydroxyethylthiazole kinase-like uncharacterized protein yjeF